MARPEPYSSWEIAKKNLMPGGPAESTVLVCGVGKGEVMLDSSWREFTTMVLGIDERLYLRFVGKPNKAAQGKGLHSYPQGGFISVDWKYPTSIVTYAHYFNKINFLKYGFQVYNRKLNIMYSFSVNQREWLDWLPISRRIRDELKINEISTLVPGPEIKKQYAINHAAKATLSNNTTVFVKKLRTGEMGPIETLIFLRTIHMNKAIDCPYIVKTIGVHFPEHDKSWCMLVSEFVPNSISLEQHLKSKKILSIEDILLIAESVAKGLDYLCTAIQKDSKTFGTLSLSLEPDGSVKPTSLCHGDIKPANILLVIESGKITSVKISDVRLTLIAPPKLFLVCNSSTAYTAPEKFNSMLVKDCVAEQKMDVYSFGMVLFELATGEKPWIGLSDLEIWKRITQKNSSIENRRPTLPQEALGSPFLKLITKCWADNPDDRPNTGLIIQELEQTKACQDL